MCSFWAPRWWAAAQPHWPSAKEAAGTTGHEPNSDTSLTGPVIIAAKTGFTLDPTAMNAGIGATRTGRKAIVMAAIGKKAIDTGATGKKVIVMADTGRVDTVTDGIGTVIGIIATTPDAMRRLPAMTDTAGITTGTHRAIA